MLRAEMYIKMTDFQSATFNYLKATQLQPRNDEYRQRLCNLYDVRACCLMEAGMHSEAMQPLDEAIKMQPLNPTLRLHRALAYTGMEHHSEAIEELREYEKHDESNPIMFLLRAKLHLVCQQMEAARDDVQHALQLEPEMEEATFFRDNMLQSSNLYCTEAVKLLLLGESEAAVQNLSNAISLNSQDVQLYMRRGVARRAKGELEGAAEDLQIAISMADGSYPRAQKLLILTFNDIGVRHFEAGRFEEAIGWFDKAIEANPTLPNFRINRGDCHKQLGHLQLALEDFEAAHGMDTNDWQVKSRLSFLFHQMGVEHFNKAGYQQAVTNFSRAIEYNPRVAHYYVSRANTSILLQDYKVARDDALTALQLQPSNQKAQALLSNLCPGI